MEVFFFFSSCFIGQVAVEKKCVLSMQFDIWLRKDNQESE